MLCDSLGSRKGYEKDSHLICVFVYCTLRNRLMYNSIIYNLNTQENKYKSIKYVVIHNVQFLFKLNLFIKSLILILRYPCLPGKFLCFSLSCYTISERKRLIYTTASISYFTIDQMIFYNTTLVHFFHDNYARHLISDVRQIFMVIHAQTT